jgi:mono/diheme cytochrome c family protein
VTEAKGRVARSTGLRHVRRVRATIVIAGMLLAGAAAHADPRALPGWPLYDRYCVACHGESGDGRGPAAPWLEPKPRDFTRGAFEWRRGAAISRDDLAMTIARGAPGAMPAFGDALDAAQIDQLADVVAAFANVKLAGGARAHAKLGASGDARNGAALWTSRGCVACHGDGGRGDGPAVKSMEEPPYDLTSVPFRRPRDRDDDATVRQAIADSIAFGMDGTAMPSSPQLGTDDLADLVAFVDSIRARGDAPHNAWPIPAGAVADDRKARVQSGLAIAPQGDPPASLAPAEASLSEQQCARCHAKQAREWTGTIHAQATAPGVLAQFPSMEPKATTACQRCHAPLAEQLTDTGLRAQAVTCASCHVRGWTRHGPPQIAASLIPIAGYPLVEDPAYERADFCLPCHELPARDAVAGRPLLDTYREWLLGPYMRRGVQCQHCHMPDREHTWKGVHDPDTFRQGIRVEAIAARTRDGVVSVRARLWNQGAGHFLPTTPTPAAWISIDLIDARGAVIAGAHADQRIGRAIRFVDGAWHEVEDTRIPPGDSRELADAWAGGRVGDATAARVTIAVHPDDYYEGFYQAKLDAHPPPAERALYEQALARATASHYVAETIDVRVTIAP